MKNRKGFTLVELLAVIVVLAIIMIIAVPAVTTAMDNAKKSSLRIFAQNAIRKAMEVRQTQGLSGATEQNCFTLSTDLGLTPGKFHGTVNYNGGTFTATISGNGFKTDGAKTFDQLAADGSVVANTGSEASDACS